MKVSWDERRLKTETAVAETAISDTKKQDTARSPTKVSTRHQGLLLALRRSPGARQPGCWARRGLRIRCIVRVGRVRWPARDRLASRGGLVPFGVAGKRSVERRVGKECVSTGR